MNEKRLQQELLAVLFAAGEPMEASRLANALSVTMTTVYKAVESVNAMLEKNTPFTILSLGSCYQLAVKQQFSPVVRRALESRRNAPLSQAAMEVLAIIAYNQPVSKSFIEQVRGVDSKSIVNSLVEKGLVEEAGRLELPGRPLSYRTSPNFLRCFGLSSLSELPPVPGAPQEEAQEGEES